MIGSPGDNENGDTAGSVSVFGLALNPGDLDLDNDVDFDDFCRFAEFWLEDDCEPCRCDRADFNRDSRCDYADLSELATHWLRGK